MHWRRKTSFSCQLGNLAHPPADGPRHSDSSWSTSLLSLSSSHAFSSSRSTQTWTRLKARLKTPQGSQNEPPERRPSSPWLSPPPFATNHLGSSSSFKPLGRFLSAATEESGWCSQSEKRRAEESRGEERTGEERRASFIKNDRHKHPSLRSSLRRLTLLKRVVVPPRVMYK